MCLKRIFKTLFLLTLLVGLGFNIGAAMTVNMNIHGTYNVTGGQARSHEVLLVGSTSHRSDARLLNANARTGATINVPGIGSRSATATTVAQGWQYASVIAARNAPHTHTGNGAMVRSLD